MADICNIGDERQLLSEDVTVTVAAGSTVSNTFTLTTGRGNIQGVAVVANNSTDAFLTTIQFQINNTTVLKNQNAGIFVPNGGELQLFPVRWEQGSVISWTIVNTGAATVTVVFKLYYVLPLIY